MSPILCDRCDLEASRMIMTGPPSGRFFLCEEHANDGHSIFKGQRLENARLRIGSGAAAVREMRDQNVRSGRMSAKRRDELNEGGEF